MKRILLPFLASLFIFSACSPSETSENNASNKAAETPKAAEDEAPKAAPAEAPKAAPAAEEKKVDVQAENDLIAKLINPAALNDTAPAKFVVLVKTTKGDMRFELDRSWAPKGVDRFYNLVKNGYYNDIGLFRMVQGFVIQFGIHGKPVLNDVWREATIEDDPVTQSNVEGTLTFATSGPNSRTTQLFINVNDNVPLDKMGFSPLGKIISGQDVLEKLNYEYAERPNQMRIQTQGNEYLKANFPNLDYIISMSVEE